MPTRDELWTSEVGRGSSTPRNVALNARGVAGEVPRGREKMDTPDGIDPLEAEGEALLTRIRPMRAMTTRTMIRMTMKTTQPSPPRTRYRRMDTIGPADPDVHVGTDDKSVSVVKPRTLHVGNAEASDMPPEPGSVLATWTFAVIVTKPVTASSVAHASVAKRVGGVTSRHTVTMRTARWLRPRNTLALCQKCSGM